MAPFEVTLTRDLSLFARNLSPYARDLSPYARDLSLFGSLAFVNKR